MSTTTDNATAQAELEAQITEAAKDAVAEQGKARKPRPSLTAISEVVDSAVADARQGFEQMMEAFGVVQKVVTGKTISDEEMAARFSAWTEQNFGIVMADVEYYLAELGSVATYLHLDIEARDLRARVAELEKDAKAAAKAAEASTSETSASEGEGEKPAQSQRQGRRSGRQSGGK